MDRWMIRLMYWWMDRLIDQCIDGWIYWLIDRWIDRSMDRSIGWLMDGWMDEWINEWMDQSNDLWIYGSMDCPPPPLPHLLWPPATTKLTDSNTFLPRKDIVNAACLCFGSVPAVPLVSSSSLEWKSSSAREGGANLAVPIGTTTSCKCKYV